MIKSRVVLLNSFNDVRGCLLPMEFGHMCPFTPQRVFTVTGVPKGTRRGGHAHKWTEQLLVCIAGRIGYELQDGEDKVSGELRPNQCIWIPRMIWDSQVFYSTKDVLLVLCNLPYDEKDYIRDFDEYLRWWKNGGSLE